MYILVCDDTFWRENKLSVIKDMEQRSAEICDSFFVIKFISGTLNSWVHLMNIF